MFIHNFKYAMKTMLKNKTALVWTLLFPIGLGTFMYAAFGNIYASQMYFGAVPVAVVEEEENAAFQAVLKELSEQEEPLLEVYYMTAEEAKSAVTEEKISGIIYQGETLKLQISGDDYDNTVLKSVVDEYLKQEAVFTDIAMNYPEALGAAVENLASDQSFYTTMKMSEGNLDLTTNYFYAVFAMSCLFASFGAVEKVGKLQANISPLGMRRALNPNNKMPVILAEFGSMLIFQVLVEIVALGYFILLGVDFGTKYPAMIGILFFGSCIGIAQGIIIGSSRLPASAKNGLPILISMTLSVLADLVATGIKDKIEHVAPILNRINPATLISDSFYALNIYDTYDRYFRNMAILAVMTIVLLGISYLILRRNKYASL